jgi:hypothetical protein
MFQFCFMPYYMIQLPDLLVGWSGAWWATCHQAFVVADACTHVWAGWYVAVLCLQLGMGLSVSPAVVSWLLGNVHLTACSTILAEPVFPSKTPFGTVQAHWASTLLQTAQTGLA